MIAAQTIRLQCGFLLKSTGSCSWSSGYHTNREGEFCASDRHWSADEPLAAQKKVPTQQRARSTYFGHFLLSCALSGWCSDDDDGIVCDINHQHARHSVPGECNQDQRTTESARLIWFGRNHRHRRIQFERAPERSRLPLAPLRKSWDTGSVLGLRSGASSALALTLSRMPAIGEHEF